MITRMVCFPVTRRGTHRHQTLSQQRNSDGAKESEGKETPKR
jgi:hypothetical protein